MYDVALVGGGLAGLAAAIALAKQGWRVVLFEQEHYPFHKVCGEYLAEESLGFLARLGLPWSEMALPRIQQACFSSPSGAMLELPLQPGGIGISRYTLDMSLVNLAREAGAEIRDGERVKRIGGSPGAFGLATATSEFQARVVAGTWGKFSNLDVQLQREFVQAHYRAEGMVGVKYHVQARFPRDRVALHSFPGGYCGVSAIENDQFCMAYLVEAQRLKGCKGSIEHLEATLLRQNPHLDHLLSHVKPLYPRPLVISQVHFRTKSAQSAHVLMAGDSAGMVAPLSGNGMSMALRAAALLTEWIPLYLNGKLTHPELEQHYSYQWQQIFGARIRTGLWLQRLLRHPTTANGLIGGLRWFPRVVAALHHRTHGTAF